ncbi:hypothetical protein CBR_g49914 [Chara braunii]|uniref:Reverse transcriptase domain-containing protein n=1 Tax=Chara braunii TaxID=69332 RepID=A0A388JPA7_CHABU|nr:hypothetical protein CBR_g49914 [Chara braunii]|eukprot:GBG59650.1 hypothetical protein CBR_g49914 [Chara braunii]
MANGASSAASSSASSSGTNGGQLGMPTSSTSSLGTSGSTGSRQSFSQMAGAQFSPLTPRQRELREIQQVEMLRRKLEQDLKEATDRENAMKTRAARLETLEADKAELEGLDESALTDPLKVLKKNMLSLHAHVDSKLDFMQSTLDQILDALTKPGFRRPTQSPLPLSAMSSPFQVQADKFAVVYLDDILIFSKSAEEHAKHVEIVLSLLRQRKYKVNLEKCEFGHTKILYLGHEVTAEGIRPEDAKVASIRDWPRPQTVTEVRSSLAMCGYYRNFVKNYSTVASLLTDLTRLDTPWDWSNECENAFKRLKHALMNHEVLMVSDPQKSFIVTTDASQYGIGAVLAQQDGKKLRPIEYMSMKMPSKKLAKSTYERELYALYKALVHWRHFLLERFFYLRTDHQTLKWIKTQPALSDALKRWIEVIDQYDFKLEYLKGEYNKVADALSRRADYQGLSVSMDFMDTLVTSKSGPYYWRSLTMIVLLCVVKIWMLMLMSKLRQIQSVGDDLDVVTSDGLTMMSSMTWPRTT